MLYASACCGIEVQFMCVHGYALQEAMANSSHCSTVVIKCRRIQLRSKRVSPIAYPCCLITPRLLSVLDKEMWSSRLQYNWCSMRSGAVDSAATAILPYLARCACTRM
jgi:hypothetical protein